MRGARPGYFGQLADRLHFHTLASRAALVRSRSRLFFFAASIMPSRFIRPVPRLAGRSRFALRFNLDPLAVQ
jgi:hypothetical protein